MDANRYADFRDFLTLLEHAGKLVRVSNPVSTRFDIAAGIRKVSDSDGPALLYENIQDCPGWRVAAGVFATRKLLALALGVPEAEMLNDTNSWSRRSFRPRPFRPPPSRT